MGESNRMEYGKVVLFTGDTETLAYFSRRLMEYFSSRKKQVFLFDFEEELSSFLKLSWFLEPGNTVMVTFNFIGFCGEDIFIEKNGMSIWDNRKIPCINIVVDHPFYYHKFCPLLPKRYVQFSIDRDHQNYLERFFRRLFLAVFCRWQEQNIRSLRKRMFRFPQMAGVPGRSWQSVDSLSGAGQRDYLYRELYNNGKFKTAFRRSK